MENLDKKVNISAAPSFSISNKKKLRAAQQTTAIVDKIDKTPFRLVTINLSKFG